MIDPASRRTFSLPRILRFVNGPAQTAETLLGAADGRAIRLAVLHTGGAGSGYGMQVAAACRELDAQLDELVIEPSLPRVAEATAWVTARQPDLVVAIGGGRATDFGKYVAAGASVAFVSVPTQASSDGICSPVAVIVDGDGRPHSLAARIPFGIVIDRAVLQSAPERSWLAGAGDLISNLSAVRDWRLAAERDIEPIDDFACVTSEAAALSIVEDRADLGSTDYRLKLLNGLILSGVAMEMAGSSRPASGSEHLISHALDCLLPIVRPHGLQVALAAIAAYLLRGEDPSALLALYARIGLPIRLADLDIDWPTFERAIRLGPSMRPGRWTILSELDDSAIAALRDRYRDEGWVTGA